MREESGHWLETVLEEVVGDGTYNVKVNGVFSTSLRTVGDYDLIHDLAPHYTHVSKGMFLSPCHGERFNGPFLYQE